MNYMKYSRSFIMLEEQSDQFAARETPIKGYLKVETGNNKGALRCAVQNLRYYEKGDYIYKLILFGKKHERTIHTIIGTLLINRHGNGETYFRFQPQDLDGKGSNFHDYSVVIVAAASSKDEKEPLHPILKGLIAPDASSAGTARAARVDDIDLNESDEELGSEAEAEAADGNEAETDGEARRLGRKPVSKKVYNQFYNEYILHACDHTCRVGELYEEVQPFTENTLGARWKKVVNIMSLPLVSPGAHYFATQYNHYLFGVVDGIDGRARAYYFGVPGRNMPEEQPDGGRSGFTYWQPVRGAEDQKNAYGYWILAVDAVTGDIQEI